MYCKIGDFGVTLRPLFDSEIEGMLPLFNSAVVHEWTTGRYSQTVKTEREWFDKVSSDKNGCQWAIVPDGSDVPVGITGIHEMSRHDLSGISGIIIWDRAWWGKGVAKRAHLARTLWAADREHVVSISSHVVCPNQASKRALESVGYVVWGVEPARFYKNGRYWDCYNLKWFHPKRVSEIYPKGIPDQFREGVKKAEAALKLAREVVAYL